MNLLTPAECPVVTSDKIRYADTDRQGHVNNAAFATFCETGRVEILYDPAHPLTSDGGEFVIVSLNLVFKDEIQWPGEVTIGTYVTVPMSAQLPASELRVRVEQRLAEFRRAPSTIRINCLSG
jgi:YbgC/YbaW family acyl-CoA thioester hydrolase